MCTSLTLLLVLAAPTPAQRLADAKKLANELQYEQALKVLSTALDQAQDVDHETLVGLYALSGICYSAVEKPAKAREAFQRLLTIAPDYELSKDLPPRTRTPFFEAKTWLEQNPAISVKVEPEREGPAVKGLTISVTENALLLPKSVRVAVTVGGTETTKVAPLDQGRARVPVEAAALSWKVEVLGDKGVLQVASGAVEPPTPKETALAPPPPPAVEAQKSAGGVWMRPTGIGLGVAGVAALAAGGVFGYLCFDARGKIDNAEKDPNGIVTGITEKEAQALDTQARTFAVVANILFVAGGVMAATGLGLFLFGDDGSPNATTALVQLSPLGAFAQVRF